MVKEIKNNSEYPRVLIVNNSRINEVDQHGVSIRGWFGDWPKEKLAQIYSGGEVGEEVFCGYNFKIGKDERQLGKYFFKLKDSSIGQSSYPIQPDKEFHKFIKLNFWELFKNKTSTFLINTGLWEVIFRPILSKELIRFVEEYNPQIIYCQGYNLFFTWLPIMLHNKFHVPICFQTGDDWPKYLYNNTLISFAIKPIVDHAVKSLFLKSTIRLANGKLMVDEYSERYNMLFHPLMMCDDINRFRKSTPLRVVNDNSISILYTGGLGHGRWVSIVDLCHAAELLQNEGLKIKVTALATTIPQESVNILKEIQNLQILPGPSHEELPSYLKGADILYLPETFDFMEANVIHLSISTKAHLYMMSEKPILLYASPLTGIVNYAKEEKWALIVQERDLIKLAEGLRKLINDKGFCNELVSKGIEIVSKNHNESKVRSEFFSLLCKTKNANS